MIPLIRWVKNFQRPSKNKNLNQLKKRGEDISSFQLREATIDDVPALVDLHVITWNATYPGFRNPPTHAIRDYQWRKAFTEKNKDWVCLVLENSSKELIGFVQANRFNDESLAFKGQLNKIYLLWSYHRLGLGRKMVCAVARRFIDSGINSMLLFSEPDNPSIYFYEALGAEKLLDEKGNFHGAYGWRDLTKLHNACLDFQPDSLL